MNEEFKRIYESELAYVWKCLQRLGVPDRDLEDKVHDVFVVFYRRLNSFDRTRPIRPWLGGIAARVASDHRRLAHRNWETSMDEVKVVDYSPSPEKVTEQTETQRLVLAALKRLDEHQQTVFVLHDIEGHPIPEIAEMLDVSINTLYSRLRLARDKFTTSIGRLRMQRGIK